VENDLAGLVQNDGLSGRCWQAGGGSLRNFADQFHLSDGAVFFWLPSSLMGSLSKGIVLGRCRRLLRCNAS